MAEGCKVHIGGLDRDKETPKEEIEREFSRFQESGDVNVWVARKPPGFAFVTFTDARDAEDACKELNGKSLFGQENVVVEVVVDTVLAAAAAATVDTGVIDTMNVEITVGDHHHEATPGKGAATTTTIVAAAAEVM
eukprot:gene18187-30808_t